jgi:hypothetical protein
VTNVAIYSAIYGDYEASVKPIVGSGAAAFMFTDNPKIAEQCEPAGWRPVLTEAPYAHFEANPANGDPAVVRPMLAHKFWKTHPREAFWTVEMNPDVSIWLDGSMELVLMRTEFASRCLAALGDDDWSVMPHPWRNCIFDEAVYSSTLIFRYNPAAMMRQHDAYLEAGHPRGWGLFATGNMVRRHTDAVQAVGQDWWLENLMWSHQDQISLPFMFAKHTQSIGWAGQCLGPLKWNANLPWGEFWKLHPHGA